MRLRRLDSRDPNLEVTPMWRLAGVLAGAVLSASAVPAAAEPLVGAVGGDSLVPFDSATPGAATAHAISGLTGGATERVAGLDFRGADQKLYALTAVDNGATDTLRLYTVDPGTGVATPTGVA